MTTYLINHLRIPGDIPNGDALHYLERVEATAAPFGGKWLAKGVPDVVEGAWPGSVVLMEFPGREAAAAWYLSVAYQAILPLRMRNAVSDLILIDALPEGGTIGDIACGIRRTIGGMHG